MKGKILCPAGCQNHRSRITKAKEILKNPRPTGSWRPLKCIFSGKEKRPPTAGRKPCPVRSMYGKTRQGQSAAVTEQVSTTVPKSAILRFCPSRETCWGVPSPNPALRLAPLILAALMRQERRSRLCERNTTHPTAGAFEVFAGEEQCANVSFSASQTWQKVTCSFSAYGTKPLRLVFRGKEPCDLLSFSFGGTA